MLHSFDTGDRPKIYDGEHPFSQNPVEYPFSHSPEVLATSHPMAIDSEHFIIVEPIRTPETYRIIRPEFKIIGPNSVELVLDEPFGYRCGSDRWGDQGAEYYTWGETPKVSRLHADMSSEIPDCWVIGVETDKEKLSVMDKICFTAGISWHILSTGALEARQ